MVGRAGSHDAQDGDDEQGSQGHGRADEGHGRADEGHGEDDGHDGEGRRGGRGQGGEEADEGASEGREHEGGQAERPGAGLRVGAIAMGLDQAAVHLG